MSESTQLISKWQLASSPRPRSAISHWRDCQRGSGDARAKASTRASALGRPQSPSRKKNDRERLLFSTTSGSTTKTEPAPRRPRVLTTSLPNAPAPTTTRLIWERAARSRGVSPAWGAASGDVGALSDGSACRPLKRVLVAKLSRNLEVVSIDRRYT